MMPTPVRDAEQPQVTGQGSLLAVGLESSRTRLCLLESIHGAYRVAAWLTVPRQGERHLGERLAGGCRRLGRRLGRRLWDEEAHAPLLTSADPIRRPPLEQLGLALSPLPPLRVWLAGLSDGYSLAAARHTAAACMVEVVGETILSVETQAELTGGDQLGRALRTVRPDVVVLAGSYDQDDPLGKQPVHILGTLLGNALLSLTPATRPLLLYAGNRFAANELQTLMQQAALSMVVVPNVMPTPGVIRQGPLARALDEYAAHLTQRLDGYRLLAQWHTAATPPLSVEANFVRLVEAWRLVQNLTDLHAVYSGDRRLHVWSAEGRDGVVTRTFGAESLLVQPDGWPRLQLVSGGGPPGWYPPDPAGRDFWWDRHGLAPLAATLGAAAPAAVYQALVHDILPKPEAASFAHL